MSEPEWRALNRANWDERVDIHLNAPNAYDLTRLRDGTASLDPIASAVLGPPAGLRILHLQCHFGWDTITMARAGASAVGLDFSPRAIEVARGLAGELALEDRVRFVLSDLYDVREMVPEPASFDRVFVSWGALPWLPDIRTWGQIVAHFLKPGGYLALAEGHPAAWVFDDAAASPDGRPGWLVPYLGREVFEDNNPVDYADPDTPIKNSRTNEFPHPLSDIIMALIGAGLRLDEFQEHDSVPWRMFKCLVRGEGRYYRWPDRPWLPLSYSLRASKPG